MTESKPLAFVNVLIYGLLAARAGAMARNPRAVSVFNKVGGSLLISAGVAAATVAEGVADRGD